MTFLHHDLDPTYTHEVPFTFEWTVKYPMVYYDYNGNIVERDEEEEYFYWDDIRCRWIGPFPSELEAFNDYWSLYAKNKNGFIPEEVQV